MGLFKGFPGVVNDTGLLNEVIHAKGGEEFGCPVGGQDVVWSCKVIPQWFAAVFPDKDSSCVLNLCHDLKGIGGDNLKMLWRNVVGCLHRLFHGIRNQDVSVIIKGPGNDMASG